MVHHIEDGSYQVLRQRVETLSLLCKELDPFKPISEDQEKIIYSLGIKGELDPFQITNQLLILLEESREQLVKIDSALQ